MKYDLFIFLGPSSNQKEGNAHQTIVFSDGDTVEVHNTGSDVCHFVLIGGKPLNEPIVQYGEFLS